MLGGRMVWVGMSRGRFVGGRNVKAQGGPSQKGPVILSIWVSSLLANSLGSKMGIDSVSIILSAELEWENWYKVMKN
jgi:hypothetical protein